MFYCKKCAKRRGWPERIFMSKGRCEICGELRPCYDIPSHELPVSEKVAILKRVLKEIDERRDVKKKVISSIINFLSLIYTFEHKRNDGQRVYKRFITMDG